MKQYDEELHYENRCLRTHSGKLLFGPTGNRLAIDILEKKPGFVGSIDFIHKMNVTELFTIGSGQQMNLDEARFIWYPTHLTMEYEDEEVCIEEKKTVIASDVAITVIKWTNRLDKPIPIYFSSNPDKFEYSSIDADASTNYRIYSESPELRFGIKLGIVASWNYPTNSIIVNPFETVTILGAAAVGNRLYESITEIQNKIQECLRRNENLDSLFDKFVKENKSFYEEAPQFLCDDKLISACWKYRWYILKNTISRPGMGNLKEAVMYEGRDHRMSKDPLHPSGWEFSKLIPLSTPLHVNDLRWHSNHKLTKEIIRSAFASQDEDGLMLCSYVETVNKSYANYMLWSIWLLQLIDPDTDFIKELLPRMIHYISGHEKVYMDDKDTLLIETAHNATGKEYQPSYWYFHDFPPNPKDKTTFTPLKRVDRSVYHYLNLSGLANMLRILKDPLEKKYREKAHNLKKDIIDKMWDKETGYFYDLHHETGEKAYVRNIVGIYPYWAMMTDDIHKEGILPLMDKEAFDTGSAFPSVSKDCKAFSPDGGWMGNFFKGRNGCVWCGPSWPYTTGIALEALGNESRKNGHCYDNEFDQFFMEYTRQHFRDHDRHRPYLVEHYNPITGECLSDEVDYNHSFWIDILLSYVVGITIKEDCIEIDPFTTHLRWFTLDNLYIRGHRLMIQYAKDHKRNNIQKGLTVMVDGKLIENSLSSKTIIIKI